MNRSTAEGRSVDSMHGNSQELIENSPRIKQLNAYQKMADEYSYKHPKPVLQKQNNDELIDTFGVRKGLRATALPFDTKKNERASERTHHHSVIQKVKYTPKKKAVAKKYKIKTKIGKKAAPVKKEVMTVKNNTNVYSSGMINRISLPQGVDAGPRKEAQKVARFLGGSWVGGHMVNDQLGGSGGFSNIVPITSSMNGKHRTIENRANNELTNGHGNIVEYKMNINRRETRVNGLKTVKNLPVEFRQTLDVHPPHGAMYTINGNVLTHP